MINVARSLEDDPVFIDFITQIKAGNSSYPNLTKPEFLSVFRTACAGGFFGNPLPEHFSVALSIANHPKGESFRLFLLKMRQGLPEKEVREALQDPFFLESWGKLENVGLVGKRFA